VGAPWNVQVLADRIFTREILPNELAAHNHLRERIIHHSNFYGKIKKIEQVLDWRLQAEALIEQFKFYSAGER
jgi:hypothetical protein